MNEHPSIKIRQTILLLLTALFSSMVAAKPFFSITTNSSAVQINVNSNAIITYQVYNNSGIQAKNMVYDVNYQNHSEVSVVGAGTTCTSTLQPYQSCTLQLRVTVNDIMRSFRLIPRVCTDNGIVCSVPDVNNRTLISVIAVPLTLSVNAIASDQHLQLRALTLTNSGTTSVTLNQIQVSESNSLQNLIEVCSPSTSCTPPTASQPSCYSITSLSAGGSCLIWFRSLDVATQALGNMSGDVTITLQTNPQTTLNTNTFTVNYNNDLYAGGQFTDAGGVADTNRIARWDGTTWHALSTGIPNNSVNALAIYQFDLFIGGNFTNAGGINGDRIVRWDGLAFNPLSTGINNGNVRALTVFNDELILGGDFTSPEIRIAAWDGVNFNALSSGISNNNVFALLALNSNLYVGGNFTNQYGALGDRIIQWDGLNFNALASGISNGNVFALFELNSNLYVGGNFTNQYGALGDRIIQWNGANFTPLSVVAPNNSVRALTAMGGNLILAGNFTNLDNPNGDRVVAWDGASYSALGAGIGNNAVYALAVAQNTLLFAGGTFTNPAVRIAQWNGSIWSALGSGINNTVLALIVASSLILS
jgi:hypothetical protein